MSNFEKKIGENMVDDMLPPEEKPKKPSRGTYLDRMDEEMGRGVDHSKYDDAYWERGGDSLDDLTGRGQSDTLDGGSWPKVKKPFAPMVKHPVKPAYKREEYEGPGGWVRKKLADIAKAYPFRFIGSTGTCETLCLEETAKTIADEITDLMEETNWASKGQAGNKLRTFLRAWILEEHDGWDNMVKKYKPIEEEK